MTSAQAAVDLWAKARTEEWGGFISRVVARTIHGDLVAAGLQDPNAQLPPDLFKAVCTMLPTDGTQIDSWGIAEWRPVLAYTRELAQRRIG